MEYELMRPTQGLQTATNLDARSRLLFLLHHTPTRTSIVLLIVQNTLWFSSVLVFMSRKPVLESVRAWLLQDEMCAQQDDRPKLQTKVMWHMSSATANLVPAVDSPEYRKYNTCCCVGM
eukprot:3701559-Amphidinium_carterae.1